MLPRELASRLKSKQAPVVIDVRTAMEYRTGHIPGALHAPTWKILLRRVTLPDRKDAELVLTCEHGPRAQLARKVLEFFGYRRVDLLEGHMAGWRQARYPTER